MSLDDTVMTGTPVQGMPAIKRAIVDLLSDIDALRKEYKVKKSTINKKDPSFYELKEKIMTLESINDDVREALIEYCIWEEQNGNDD